MKLSDIEVDKLTRPELERLRLSRLREIVGHAYEHSPFWRERLQGAGVAPDDITTVQDFTSRVPMVTKSDLLLDQAEAEPYGRRLAVRPEEIGGTFLTSGSSGRAQEVHALTPADMTACSEMWGSALRWGGVRPGDVAFLMVPIGVTVGPVSLFNAYRDYGLQTFAVGSLGGEERLAMMLRFKPNYFSCSPIYLRRLTRIARSMDIDPRRDFPDLRAIKLGTFGYTAEWAKEMDEFWGATLIDTYASTQAGVGSTCENGVGRVMDRPALMHMPDHRGLYEVVDPDTGESVDYGDEGELVVTPFDRAAMPLLRFRTGDRVRRLPHGYCSCGRPHDGFEAGAIARYDNMIKVRGMNLWTQSIDDLVLTTPGVTEYNGLVKVDEIGREVVEIRVLFDPDAAIGDDDARSSLDDLSARIKESTNVKCQVVRGTTDDVRRIEYKERRWLDQRRETM